MFIGHFALGFAAKRAAPAVSLGALFLSCQFADLLWPNLVLSHWVLDVVAHRPDVPLTIDDGTKLGLELWRSRPATIAVEAVMLAAGVAIYATTTTARDRAGTFGLWGLVAFLVIINIANMFGPPPPSVAAVAWSAQALWLLVAWAYWIDRHRTAKGAA